MTKSKRKPYVRPLGDDFWLKDKFRKLYLIKESSAIPLFFFFAELFILLILGHTNPILVVEFLSHPISIIYNIGMLLIAIFNTLVWFHLTPKAINLVRNGKKVSQHYVTMLITIAWLVFSLILAIIFIVVG